VGQQPGKVSPAPRVDAYGDPLPAGAVARLGTMRLRLRGQNEILGFSADGKSILAIRDGSGLYLLDSATARPRRQIPLPTPEGPGFLFRHLSRHQLSFLPLSGDLRTLALPDAKGGICFLDLPSAKKRGRVPHEDLYPPINNSSISISNGSSQLSHDGKLFAVSGQQAKGRTQVAWFDTDRGKQVHRISSEPGASVGVMAFTRDGKALAFVETLPDGPKPRLRLWDTLTGKEIRSVSLPPSLGEIRFLPDGKSFLAVDTENIAIRLLETATGKEVRRFAQGDGLAQTFTLSADGKLLLILETGQIHVVDIPTGKELRSLKHPHLRPWQHTAFGAVGTSVLLSPDGKTLAAPTKYGLLLWDLVTGKELYPTGGHVAPVRSVAFDPVAKRLVSAAADGSLRVWELPSGKEDRRFLSFAKVGEDEAGPGIHTGSAHARFSPDGKAVLAAAGNLPLQFWDVGTARPRRQFGDGKVIYPAALSPDGRLLAGAGPDGLVPLWDPRTGKQVRRLVWQKAPPKEDGRLDGLLFGLAFSPDGQTLTAIGFVGARDKLRAELLLWETRTGSERLRIELDGSSAGDADRGLGRIYVLLSRGARGEFVGMAQAFSPDGKTLAVGIGNVIYLWDVNTGKELRQFAGVQIAAAVLAFSPDGKLLAAGRDDGIRLWRADTGALWCDIPGHEHPVTALAFSPDGKTLASGSEDSTVLVWDVTQFPPGRRAPARGLTAAEREALWADLAGADAARAYRAVGALAAEPGQAVPLLKARLRPVAPPEPERVTRLLTELESKRFTVRQRAAHELEGLGDLAEPALEKLLAAKPPLETRQRVEAILERLRGPTGPGDMLRALRAVEVLERISSPPARAVLRALAGGAPGHRVTEEARASLARLSR
jgi:WD40 repeat protein